MGRSLLLGTLGLSPVIGSIVRDSEIFIEAMTPWQAAAGESRTDIFMLRLRTVKRIANSAIRQIESMPFV